MFDLYSGGSHRSTTRVLLNGITGTPGAIDMGPSGIALGTAHPLRVDLAYDVTQLALSETVTDTMTGSVFQHVTTNLNIPQIVGATSAFVGFTGSTGGETAIQDIVNWSGRFLAPVQPVSHFTFLGADATAGTPITLTVTAQDAFNYLAPDHRGTVHFTSSDPRATLPDDYTFSDADQGVHVFPGIILVTAGLQTITAQDTALPFITAGATLTITPAAASDLVVSGFPSPTPAGVIQTFTVTALDPYGNVATGYTGTVTFGSSDLGALFQGDYTFTADDAGTHQFSAVLVTAGSQSITATDTVRGIGGSHGGILVTAGPAAAFFVEAPASVQAGTPFVLVLVALDRFGNLVPDYGGTVTFSTSDPGPGVFLPPAYTFQPSDGGEASFSITLQTPGQQTVTITDTADPSLTFTITIAVG